MNIPPVNFQPNQAFTFADLPEELKINIFNFVPLEPLMASLSLVSKEWNRLSNDHSLRNISLNTVFGENPPSIPWKEYFRALQNLKNGIYTEQPVLFPAQIDELSYDYFRNIVLDNGQLLEISHTEGSSEVNVRNVMTNEILLSHKVDPNWLDINLKGENLFIFSDVECHMYNLDRMQQEPLLLKDINIAGVYFEEDLRYVLCKTNIYVKTLAGENRVVDTIENSDSKIIKIATTPHHIICQLKKCCGKTVIAISKKSHEEQSLSYFNNTVSQTLEAVTGPYVIVRDTAHQVYIWKENDDGTFVQQKRPQGVNFGYILPIFNQGHFFYAPNPPYVNHYKGHVIYSYEGILSIWNIETLQIIARLQHEIYDIYNLTTNGRQLFINGRTLTKELKQLFWDFLV